MWLETTHGDTRNPVGEKVVVPRDIFTWLVKIIPLNSRISVNHEPYRNTDDIHQINEVQYMRTLDLLETLSENQFSFISIGNTLTQSLKELGTSLFRTNKLKCHHLFTKS